MDFPAVVSMAWEALLQETLTTSADPELKKIKNDLGSLGCLIIIMLSLCLGNE